MTPIRTRPEQLWVGMVLAAVGGFLDAYTFVSHGVFATAQTGNVVLLAIDAANARWDRIAAHLPPVIAFLLGVGLAETIARPRVRAWLRRPTRVVLGAEILVLAVIGVLPASTTPMVTTVAISFVAALQISTFNLLGDTSYNTTMITGNLRTMLAAAHRWLLDRQPAAGRRALDLAAVVVAFVLGAVISAMLTRVWGPPAILVGAALLATVLVGLVLQTRRLEARVGGR